MNPRHSSIWTFGAVLLALLSVAAERSTKAPAPAKPAAPEAPFVPTERMPVPEASAQAAAEKVVREVFKTDYANRDPAARQALGRKLLEQSAQNQNDPAGRFVMLREARDVAASAGDVATVCGAVQRLGQAYLIETPPMLLTALTTAQRAAPSPAAQAGIAQSALGAVDRAVAADDYTTASGLAALAGTAAQKARNQSLTTHAKARASELQRMQADFAKANSARQSLKQKPDDPAAALDLGSYLCFSKGDWAAGRPLLAQGSDEELKKLAADDLEADTDPGKRKRVADAWWEYAKPRFGLARRNIEARAALRYRQALSSLVGLDKSLAQTRIDEFSVEVMREMNLAPGLMAELFKGTEFGQPVKVRVDAQIDFDWGDNAPDEALPKDYFSLRWTGVLRPPEAGKYQLAVAANTAVRVWIDDRLVFDEPDLARQPKGTRKAVDLSAEPHPIRIDYWDKAGAAWMRLKWQPPGAKQEEAVPASAFYHDLMLMPAEGQGK